MYLLDHLIKTILKISESCIEAKAWLLWTFPLPACQLPLGPCFLTLKAFHVSCEIHEITPVKLNRNWNSSLLRVIFVWSYHLKVCTRKKQGLPWADPIPSFHFNILSTEPWWLAIHTSKLILTRIATFSPKISGAQLDKLTYQVPDRWCNKFLITKSSCTIHHGVAGITQYESH